MGVKRPLGLGAKAKANAKKSKPASEGSNGVESEDVQTPASNELTVELNEEADAEDEIAQLKALWKTYYDSDRDNELVLNGIVHECDRLLRNNNETKDEPSTITLKDDFHSIYALALAELSNFHVDDGKIAEYFDASLERIDLGLEKFPKSAQLQMSKARILLSRIALEQISKLSIDSKVDTKEGNIIVKELNNALKAYEAGEKLAETNGQFELFNEQNFDVLESLDDILDIIDNFGKDDDDEEENDDDEEDDDDDEDQQSVELAETHPLFSVRNTDEYNQWWRDHIIKYLENLDQQKEDVKRDSQLRRDICKRVGQSYLQESEIPSSVYTSLTYDDDYAGIEELEGLKAQEAQTIARDLISTALTYLKQAEDKEDPETWVAVAEAMISLGNLYDVDSDEQEGQYVKAEEILKRANNVTNGKYEDVLENLLSA
ncbi:enhancer of translation termination 1 [Scheffersomyces amazonensis]|uniref:enhancer of translation termination 1 n=1 Tax=Scheffersomyces amazonensis TaxID=1078765 RepID=UPI00315C953B